MLSTTLFSDKNIKKAKSTVGYFTEGTMIYAGGMPFVLIRLENTNTKHLINIIPSSTDLLNGIKTGDTVKLYHSSAVPLTAAPTLVADGVVIIDKEAHTSLSEEDIAFIQSQGYSIDN